MANNTKKPVQSHLVAAGGERTAYTLREVGQRTGLSEASIRRAVRSGELKAVVVSRGKRPVWRITTQAEAAWLESLDQVVQS